MKRNGGSKHDNVGKEEGQRVGNGKKVKEAQTSVSEEENTFIQHNTPVRTPHKHH